MMTDAPAPRNDRSRANGSPSAQPSKRDKRRQMISDRLIILQEKFCQERDQMFREQLQRIQVDANLVMRVDPYAERPFENVEDEHQRLKELEKSGDGESSGKSVLLDVAGPTFQTWMQHVQDLVEARDFTITKYMFDFDKKSAEYRNTYAFKVETANREHRALSQTIRDRLINILNEKKRRLNKEKEVLEISDASALLLHPNQFSLTNPASPGGTLSKRATRLRRETDDLPGLERKRRRNGEEDGLPGPQRRAHDTTPLWQADRLKSRRTAGPIHSIDSLFNDKELTMAYNTAARGAHRYILTHKPRIGEDGHLLSSSPEDSDAGSGDPDEHDADSNPSAPIMERNVSHATRSARGAGGCHANYSDNKLMGLEALTNLDFRNNFERMIASDPRIPPTFQSGYIRGHTKQSDFNTPVPLSADDVSGDLMVMNALKQYDAINGKGSNFSFNNGSRSILETVSHPVGKNRFVAFLQGERPAEDDVRKQLGLPTIVHQEPSSDSVDGHAAGTPSKTRRSGTPGVLPHKGPVPASIALLGPVSMSRQSSANGASMNRSTSRKGRSTRLT